MKSVIFQGAKNIEIVELPQPVCGDNEILLKNLVGSVCGSDVASWNHGGEAQMMFPGSSMGHEMVSQVVQVGKNVEGFAVGDVVFPFPGMFNNDFSKAGAAGGFTEYILAVNCTPGLALFHVSDKIPHRVASMIEPFGIGTNAAMSAAPKAGENAIVFGAGTIGASAAIALDYAGVNVLVTDFSDFRLSIMKELGIKVCNSQKEDLAQVAADLFGTAHSFAGSVPNVDIYIDAVGANSVIETWQKMGKLKNRMVVVGVHHEPTTMNLIPLTYNSARLIGSGGFTPDIIKLVLEMMESGKYDLEKLITGVYDLDHIVDALEKAGDTNSSLKVVIDYENA